MSDTMPELKQFLRRHPKVGVLDALRPVPESELRWIQETGGRVTLVLDGQPRAVLVSLADLQLLEATDPGEQLP